MASIFNTGQSQNNQLDQLVAAYRATQQPQITRLQQQQTKLEKTSTYYNKLNGQLNSMISQIDKFKADDAASNFSAKKVTSSSSDYATATATGEAPDGLNTLRVKRLATADILISSQLTSADNFGLSGTKTLEFVINGETKSVNVDFDGTETNSDAMQKIVTAINDSDDFGITAGLVKDTTTTSKLTFRSQSTGEDYNLNFNDSEVFNALGITQAALNPNTSTRTVSTTTSAGYKVTDQAELNSYTIVNGVDVRRNSNTMTDVLSGMTISLIKAQADSDPEISLNTSVNNETAEGFIKPFIDTYNNLVKFLSSDKDQLRSDSAVSGLRFNLRSILTQEVTAAQDGNPKYLTNIGLDINSDGTLVIKDSDLLKQLLTEDPSKVSDIFLASDGIINKVKQNVDRLKGSDDLMKAKTLDIANQIDDQKKKIEDMQSRIDRQAEAQKKQYTRILDSYYQAQAQYNSFNSFIQSNSGV